MGLFSKGNSTAATVPTPPAAGSGLFTKSPAKEGAAASALSASSIVTPPQMTPPARPMQPASQHSSERQAYFQKLRVRIHAQLVERLDVQNLKALPAETVRTEVRVL